MKIDVRQATTGDYPAINTFIHEAYGDLALYKGRDRWVWQYLSNPFGEENAAPPVWIALQGDKVIGQIAVQRCGLSAGDRSYPAGWIVDVMILPAYRGLGLGHRLYSGAAQSGLALVTLTMAVATRRMANRLGAITLPKMRQWTRIEKPSPRDVARYLAARTSRRPNWARAAKLLSSVGGTHALSLAARAAAATRNSRIAHAILDQFVFTPVERFDAEIDTVWRSVADRFAGVPRTSRHLNWRFVDCPGLRYDRFIVRQDGRAAGFLVLRATEPLELRKAILVDALAFDDDGPVWEALVAFACQRFLGTTASVDAAFSTPAAIGALQRNGFIPRRTFQPTIVCANKTVLAELSTAKTWFFNRGDHDWDQIHLA